VPLPSVGPRATAATRRAALGGALASLAALSACDLDRPEDKTPGAGATPAGDPDAAIVDEVLVELGELRALVAATGAKFPRLEAWMRALGELHAAHREALDGDARSGDSPVVAFTDATEALRGVRAREQQTQRRLAGWAVAAGSGALARLLACMSAGVAQQLVVLPSKAGGDR
jgi:hypothetical protein